MEKTFYIAADYARRAEVAKMAASLEEDLGLESYTSWSTEKAEYNDDASGEGMSGDQQAGAQRAAVQDYQDIRDSGIFIQLTTGEKARGGRHAELGIAVALKAEYAARLILIVGPKENVFHYFPGVVQVPDAEALKTYLRGYFYGAETA